MPVPKKKKELTEEQIKENREINDTLRASHNLRVLIVGGGFQYMKMFFDREIRGTRSVDEADFLCFTGGEDVDPDLYGEEALPTTRFNRQRDDYEMAIFKDALAKGKPMVGICRGAQFLNVMQPGGALYQHVNNHAISGFHSIIDQRTGDEVHDMTSTHHQQMIAGDNAEVLALAKLSTIKQVGKGSKRRNIDRKRPKLDDLEVVWYPNTSCLCFQPHPEFRPGGCRDYLFELLDEYVVPAT